MVDAVTYEYFSLSRVHLHRNRDDERPSGISQPLVYVGIEAKPGCHPVELGDGRPVQFGVELVVHAAPFPLTAKAWGGKIRPKQSPIKNVGDRMRSNGKDEGTGCSASPSALITG